MHGQLFQCHAVILKDKSPYATRLLLQSKALSSHSIYLFNLYAKYLYKARPNIDSIIPQSTIRSCTNNETSAHKSL